MQRRQLGMCPAWSSGSHWINFMISSNTSSYGDKTTLLSSGRLPWVELGTSYNLGGTFCLAWVTIFVEYLQCSLNLCAFWPPLRQCTPCEYMLRSTWKVSAVSLILAQLAIPPQLTHSSLTVGEFVPTTNGRQQNQKFDASHCFARRSLKGSRLFKCSLPSACVWAPLALLGAAENVEIFGDGRGTN